MDNKSSGAAGGGITLSGLTFLVFLVLKLCNVIDWSWWWVTAPLWIPFAIFIAICIVVFIVGIFIGIARAIVKSKKGRK
jgi:hypothetical protein